jgi:hypothetical protein
MHEFSNRLDGSEIIVDDPAFYECALVRLDYLMHQWGKSVSQCLGQCLTKTVDKADWPVILHLGWHWLFPDQNHVGLID